MSYNIGYKFSQNNKEYTIVGKEAKSFILESSGKKFKATAAKIKKIEELEKQTVVAFPHLEDHVRRMKLFKVEAKIPSNYEECLSFFTGLTFQLSPENLSCDGEISKNQIRSKLKRIHAEWAELEKICGRKVPEEEIEDYEIAQIRQQLVTT